MCAPCCLPCCRAVPPIYAPCAAVAGCCCNAGKKDKVEFDEIALIKETLDCCSEGLARRGMGEEQFMAPLYTRLEERKNPAQRAIEVATDGGMEKLIQHVALPLP